MRGINWHTKNMKSCEKCSNKSHKTFKTLFKYLIQQRSSLATFWHKKTDTWLSLSSVWKTFLSDNKGGSLSKLSKAVYYLNIILNVQYIKLHVNTSSNIIKAIKRWATDEINGISLLPSFTSVTWRNGNSWSSCAINCHYHTYLRGKGDLTGLIWHL